MSWTYTNERKGSTKMDEFGLNPEGCQSCCTGRTRQITKKGKDLRKGKTWNEVKTWTALFDGSVYLS
jgi:hypothetical protein